MSRWAAFKSYLDAADDRHILDLFAADPDRTVYAGFAEAYIPRTDTFIEKDSSVNEEIERLRIAATSSLISRRATAARLCPCSRRLSRSRATAASGSPSDRRRARFGSATTRATPRR